VLNEVAGNPVHRALGQPGAPDQLGERQHAIFGSEGSQDRRGLAEHGVERCDHQISVSASRTLLCPAGPPLPEDEGMTDAAAKATQVQWLMAISLPPRPINCLRR
jgi:hypothetical protein